LPSPESKLQTNVVKHRLKAGEIVYGTSLGTCLEPEVAIVLASAGVEFFFIDTEHSATSYAQIQVLCRTARGAGLIPMVRVTHNEPSLISRALDVGAMGIIVPRVHSAAEARAAIDAVKFPPHGHRGFGLGSIVTDLKGRRAPEEIESSDRETMAVLMIESCEGLDAVDEIVKVEGVDALFIGPYDLSLALGIVEDFANPLFQHAVEKVIDAANKVGVAAGLQSSDMSMLAWVRELGARFLMYGSDISVLLSGYESAIAELKSLPQAVS
jgi:2-dehydro-3-deoxyglucarate aldolase/4-hydroxy-2-oxoheptanedioate aldolase